MTFSNFQALGGVCEGMTITFTVNVGIELSGTKYAKSTDVTVPWDPTKINSMIRTPRLQPPLGDVASVVGYPWAAYGDRSPYLCYLCLCVCLFVASAEAIMSQIPNPFE